MKDNGKNKNNLLTADGHEPITLPRLEIQDFLDKRLDALREKLKKYKVNPATQCWEWQGATKKRSESSGDHPYGYFTLGMNGRAKKMFAHRASYAVHNNQDPGKMFVCHKCDNPICINPDHLFLGTTTDNMRDMISKGRAANQSGSNNGNSKLDWDMAIEVFRLLKLGKTNKSIAAKVGISHGMVSRMRVGKAWIDLAVEVGYEHKAKFKRKKP